MSTSKLDTSGVFQTVSKANRQAQITLSASGVRIHKNGVVFRTAVALRRVARHRRLRAVVWLPGLHQGQCVAPPLTVDHVSVGVAERELPVTLIWAGA